MFCDERFFNQWEIKFCNNNTDTVYRRLPSWRDNGEMHSMIILPYPVPVAIVPYLLGQDTIHWEGSSPALKYTYQENMAQNQRDTSDYWYSKHIKPVKFPKKYYQDSSIISAKNILVVGYDTAKVLFNNHAEFKEKATPNDIFIVLDDGNYYHSRKRYCGKQGVFFWENGDLFLAYQENRMLNFNDKPRGQAIRTGKVWKGKISISNTYNRWCLMYDLTNETFYEAKKGFCFGITENNELWITNKEGKRIQQFSD